MRNEQINMKQMQITFLSKCKHGVLDCEVDTALILIVSKGLFTSRGKGPEPKEI
jgi:hypothetical protein